MTARIVFDTGVVLSALRFRDGRLAWLRSHWRARACVPLVSSPTVRELVRVLNYPKLRLSPAQQQELLADYLPYCETVEVAGSSDVTCRDPKDQIFLDLAQFANAEVLVSGDRDLLVLSGHTRFAVETPEAYRQRFMRE